MPSAAMVVAQPLRVVMARVGAEVAVCRRSTPATRHGRERVACAVMRSARNEVYAHPLPNGSSQTGEGVAGFARLSQPTASPRQRVWKHAVLMRDRHAAAYPSASMFAHAE